MYNLRKWFVGGTILLVAATAHAQSATSFNFNGNLNASAFVGTASSLGYFNGSNAGAPTNVSTQSIVSFGTTSSFGIANIGGVNKTVLKFPQFNQNQGLSFAPNVPGNGGSTSGYINNYTFGYDIYLPNSYYWAPLLQTSSTNGNDADFYVRGLTDGGGVGISGQYDGTIAAGSWNRVVLVADTVGGSINYRKYINGVLVGTQTAVSGIDGRFSLYSSENQNIALLLTEGYDATGVYTTPGYLSSFFFSNSALTANQVAALGGANGNGFNAAASVTASPEAGSLWLVAAALPVALYIVRRRTHQAKVR